MAHKCLWRAKVTSPLPFLRLPPQRVFPVPSRTSSRSGPCSCSGGACGSIGVGIGGTGGPTSAALPFAPRRIVTSLFWSSTFAGSSRRWIGCQGREAVSDAPFRRSFAAASPLLKNRRSHGERVCGRPEGLALASSSVRTFALLRVVCLVGELNAVSAGAPRGHIQARLTKWPRLNKGATLTTTTQQQQHQQRQKRKEKACAVAAMGNDSDAVSKSQPKGDGEEKLKFGKWDLDRREVFAETPLSLAIVNMKPVVPGHVLVLPRRVAKRVADLTVDELADLWLLSRRVGSAIQPFFGCSSLTYAIQDGEDAGQTVAHVHVHILPRKKGDFENNDDIYGEIEKNEKAIDARDAAAATAAQKKQRMDESEERKPRSMEEMEAEALQLRALLERSTNAEGEARV